MKYCEQCATELVKEAEAKYHCPGCGSDFYINPRGACAVFLLDTEGKLVLAKRAHEPHVGKLDPIGGFLDIGESFEEAMYRELKEESGLNPHDISELEYLGSAYDPYPWQNRITPVASVYFLAKLKDGAVYKANDDVADIVHVAIDQIGKDDVAWRGMWLMLEKFRQKFAA
jgi:NAD+ diphosphatase